jgi:hypothetical protein
MRCFKRMLSALQLTRTGNHSQFLLIANLHLAAVWGIDNHCGIRRGHRLYGVCLGHLEIPLIQDTILSVYLFGDIYINKGEPTSS